MLIRVHMVLILSAIALAVLFGLRAFVLFSREHASIDLGLGIASLAIVGALGLYFRKLRTKYSRPKTPS
jgi:hypothetical protein